MFCRSIRCGAAVAILLGLCVPAMAQAQVAVSRTRFDLPASNGHGVILVPLDHSDPGRARRITEFREHSFAAEEPVIDENGDEVWGGSDFEAIYTRDLLYDAYFGLRGPDGQLWLPTVGADLDTSGYLGWTDGEVGGTGIVSLVQNVGDLEATSYFFAPFELERNAFAMVLRVRNTSGQTISGAQAFSIHNLHLGPGRPHSPWEVSQDISEEGETLEHQVDANGHAFLERGFAGVAAIRTLGDVAHFGTTPGADPYAIVDAGAVADLPDNAPLATAVDGAVGAFQFDLGDLEPGEEAWVGLVVAHHGDPFAGTATLAELDTFVDGRDAQTLLEDEVAGWASFQSGLTIPADAGALEERLVRHSATMLRMGQVRENETWLREWNSQDGEVRRTRFPSKDDPAELPAMVEHNGRGAILASMPPGNWTYAWIRDGAYAIAAMAKLGMQPEAREALDFYLEAEAGRFQNWTELADYDMPPYQMTLVRYYGFGIEETDFNDYGPNLEFDGFGLFLWALREYERATGDQSLAEENWSVISEGIADVLVHLVEPDSGLVLPDSSIWETHWNGRERHWAYTNITAVRGLCDAADIADRVGDAERASTYRETAQTIREAIATRLTDEEGAIASNLEELQAGRGHFDAAVLDAISMGLFDPERDIAQATLAGLDANLLVDASEVGWSRNDDRWDHEGAEDLSPWGSDYDSAEWVITDLRGAIAKRLAGDSERSDAILQWILAQSNENYLMVAETYEENTGEYKFNHPMLGFGAGAYSLALFQRSDREVPVACGEYYEGGGGGETGGGDTGTDSGSSAGTGDDDSGGSTDGSTDGPSSATGVSSVTLTAGDGTGTDGDSDSAAGDDSGGCGCTTDANRPGPSLLGLGLLGVLALRRRRRATAAASLAAMLGLTACGDDAGNPRAETEGTQTDTNDTVPATTGPPPTTGVTMGGTDEPTGGPTTDPTTDTDDTTGTDTDDTWGEEVEVCPVEFSFDLPADASNPRVAGDWNGFDLATATALEPAGDDHVGTVELAPGMHAYKIIYDRGGEEVWVLDPRQGRRTYVDEVENSAVLVPDCNLPSLQVEQSTVERPGAGEGTYEATLIFVDGAAGSGPEPAAYTAVLRKDFEERALTAREWSIDPSTGDVTVGLTGLDDGKYTVVLEAATRSDRVSEPLRLGFWVEAEPFSWEDAIVYMILTDRYRDGEVSNNPDPLPNVDLRADFQGGDLWGVADAIEQGLLDDLGVRAIWLTPWQTNPEGAYLAADDFHQVTGYHGYWPVSAREVDPRFGGEEALRAVVTAAHAHGIRVLQDYVINHVHEDHEYVDEHPEWFRTGCVCGTPGCDWTAQALECQFRPYMPDINHTIPEANAQFVDDALWWVDTYDLDGLRVDAVKHVEEAATRNLSVAVTETFERSGNIHYFLMGETAMGWNDCADPCNDENYDTISRYIGEFGLDGQFDFVLYHGVSYRTFAYGDNGMLHADYWFQHGQDKWPEGSVMTPYIGSHDTARFISMADYRGQDPEHARGVPFNQWDDIALAPGDEEPYRRLRVGMAWALSLPGAPLLYYGDEYGEFGGVDPNNRLMWRSQGELNVWEADTLEFVRAVGSARANIRALRRGNYVSLQVTEDDLIFGRLEGPGQAAIVALTRADSAREVTVGTVQLGYDPGTVLQDALGGPDVTVDGDGDISFTIPGQSAVILAPAQ